MDSMELSSGYLERWTHRKSNYSQRCTHPVEMLTATRHGISLKERLCLPPAKKTGAFQTVFISLNSLPLWDHRPLSCSTGISKERTSTGMKMVRVLYIVFTLGHS